MDTLNHYATLTPQQLKQLRLVSLAGATLMLCFIFADLQILPASLHQVYLISRLLIQVPLCGLFILITFIPFYAKIHQWAVCFILLGVVYANYWLILRCWQLEGFSFPYEGTVMYSLFVLFVFRIKFNFALFFVTCTLIGFVLLITIYPIYGDRNSVSLGFVMCGLVVGLMGVYQIEAVLKKLSFMNQKLIHLSQIDQLTNILNRGTYEIYFTHLLESNKRSACSICIFFIDLDNFKAYNDGYGHVKGDEVIRLQADILKNIFRRNTDIVARYGGEEYVVVTSNLTQQQCIDSAKEIIHGWKQHKVPHGKTAGQEFVSCSIGFYQEILDKTSTKEELVDKADKALYQAKTRGRNQFVQYID
ncbi:GGDEF domain-containing protein [Paraglaciecola aquimarina]|uniref:diguanylate cyclase n=1 Tax=Paraglaciecola algarum TaxID=3050085 RepID=A0ABS9DE84_9ALTE|nr:GGDEF domain-containing protein [Paraglaciecola sp. G1-23]MCF2950318.1 GGDEF domain-containing protein [Paraglaciecola sp. G1-23]